MEDSRIPTGAVAWDLQHVLSNEAVQTAATSGVTGQNSGGSGKVQRIEHICRKEDESISNRLIQVNLEHAEFEKSK